MAAWGGLNCYEIEPSGEVSVTPLRIPSFALEDLERHMLLFYTGKTRASEEILSQQKADTLAGNAEVVDSLHRTKELGHRIKAALEEGDLVAFGQLLDEHWENKKRRSTRITDSRIDASYEAARSAGALGGKVLGAGGGGFLLVLAADGCTRRVREAVAAHGLRQMPFYFDLEGAKVLLNA